MLLKKGYRLTKRGKYVAFTLMFVLILTIFSYLSPLLKTGTVEASANNKPPSKGSVVANSTTPAAFIRGYQLSLYFSPGDSTLTVESKSALGLYLELAKILDNSMIQIEGNCASIHTNLIDDSERQLNINLSLDRAEQVAQYLEKNGISKDRLIIKGNGSDNSVNSNNTYFERKLNRRVDMIFLYDKAK